MQRLEAHKLFLFRNLVIQYFAFGLQNFVLPTNFLQIDGKMIPLSQGWKLYA